MTNSSHHRLDAFTDAAFAFSVTLLVVGAGGAPVDGDVLTQAVASIPSFAIGFAIIAMFWWAHVGARRLRGDGDWRTVLLTLLLIFVTLVYVVPLRAMATSLAAYLRGMADPSGVGIGTLFAIYGLGFSAMSVLTAMLYRDALRNEALSPQKQREALGQVWIWAILAWTGALSAICAAIPALRGIAPWLYATLPVTIGVFAWRWDWGDSVGDGGRDTGDAAAQAVLAPHDIEAARDDDRRA